MTPRIPKIETPISEPNGQPNSIWFRYFQALQAAIPSGTGIPDAPSDGVLYGRRDASWQPVPSADPVDLGYEAAPDQGTVTNTGGTDAVLPTFAAADAGLVPAPIVADATKVLYDDGIWRAVSAPENPLVLYAYVGQYKQPLAQNSDLSGLNGFGTPTVAGTTGTSPYSNTDPTRAQPYATRDTAIGSTNAGWAWLSGTGSFQAFQIGDGTIETGFRYQIIGGLSNQHQTNTGFFMGLGDFTTGIAGFTSVNPSTLVRNLIGIGLDAADTNVQLICTNSSGGVLKTSLGVARAADVMFSMVINCEPRQNGVSVEVYHINSFTSPTLVYSGQPSVLPLSSALLGHILVARQPGVATGTTGVKCARWIGYLKPPAALTPGWQ